MELWLFFPNNIIVSQLKPCAGIVTVMAGLFSTQTWQKNQLFDTVPMRTRFPNYSRILNQKKCWKISLWHGIQWMVWVFPKLLSLPTWNLYPPTNFHFMFAFFFWCFHQECGAVQSLEQGYLICVQTVTNMFVKHFWLTILSKSTSFVWSFYICCLFAISKEAQCILYLIKTFFFATFPVID